MEGVARALFSGPIAANDVDLAEAEVVLLALEVFISLEWKINDSLFVDIGSKVVFNWCANKSMRPWSLQSTFTNIERKIKKTRPFLEDTIKDILSKMVPVPCIKVADLGCASGPNTFFPACGIVDIVTRICQEAHCESPELQVLLNDLPKNDFNTVFKS
ncbi:hypothetical protein Golob_001706, partial [Gossypium lobatum]|nr:hypothetical protein [Gossypium lobatum]